MLSGKDVLLFPLFWAEMHHFLGVKVDMIKAEILYGANTLFRQLAQMIEFRPRRLTFTSRNR